MLLMRLELDDVDKECAIADFLGEPSFSMQSANVGESRDYADGYRRFKREARLPPDYVERKLASRYAQHFYSAEERREIARRWTDPTN